MRIKQILFGIGSYVPGVYSRFSRGTGGTDSAEYCYSVWLRHLVMAYKHGLLSKPPNIVAELGPGDSLGVGLAALISGSNKYYAFDIVEHASNAKNLEIFDQLVSFFRQKQNIPGEDKFPKVKPYLESYEFPSNILTDEHLDKMLDKMRIDSVRSTLINIKDINRPNYINYFVPWHNSNLIANSTVDMIFSQAVLEHIDDLSSTYEKLYLWLKASGFMSHEIDFKCHGTADKWNGHWAYSNVLWKVIKGNRPYLINRQPHSAHIKSLIQRGFEIVCDIKIQDNAGIKKKELAREFKNISDDDLTTSAAFIQVKKSKD